MYSLRLNSFLLLYILSFDYCICRLDRKVLYYENLISSETYEAYHYHRPTDASEYRPRHEGIKEYGTFDYIVIGSGSAGSVIASRLSEVMDWDILLLEAGGCETKFSDIPRMHDYLQGLRFNWNYATIPQTTSCLGMVNRSCTQPRGRVLGGTSTINGLVYSRGNRHDYDNWAAEGNEGWSYDEVLPFFKKSENSHINGDPGYHGKGGYWNVEYHRPTNIITKAYLKANQELGVPLVDYNGREELGVSRSQLSNLHGRRDSLAKAFLTPAKNRKNLKISIDSYVTKLILNNDTKSAEGVRFIKNGQTYIARIRREIILSAGAFGSPYILLHSGIGPINHLNEMGISPIANLPVGENLKDHTSFIGSFFSINYTLPEEQMSNEIKEYLKGYGPLTIALNSDVVGFYQINRTDSGVPDFELEFIPPNSLSNYTQESFGLTNETIDSLFNRVDGRSAFNVYVIGLHPRSTGHVRLASNDPFIYPIIDTNYLSDRDNHDIEVIYQGVQYLLKLSQTPALQQYNATLIPPDFPDCRQYELLSKDYWYCTIRMLTADLYHPMSTCRMGPHPENSVVDSRLRVHGIRNLRVADASIIPSMVSGHTSAPSVMIGEKMAHFIREERGALKDRVGSK